MFSIQPFRQRKHQLILAFIFITIAVASPESVALGQESKALWGKAKLTIGNTTVPVRRVRDNWPIEERIGPYLIRLKENLVEVLDFDSLKQTWAETATVDCELQLVGLNDSVIYLVEEASDETEGEVSVVKVLRREISTGKKLDDIVIPVSSAEKKCRSRVLGTIVKPDCIYLLSMFYPEIDGFASKPISYRLTKFSGTVEWSKTFDSAGALKTPGAFIIGTLGPALDGYSSQSLVEMNSNIIVNAGPLENLLAIDPKKGKVIWQIPRLWEYRRGFIGPSVWSYFLGRYGIRDHDIETAGHSLEQIKQKNKARPTIDEEYILELKKRVKAARERIETQPGWILAGPVVFKTIDDFGDDVHRLFVVTAQSDGNSPWSNYLANAVVYEISDKGSLVSMVTLPRLLQRNEFHVLNERIIWHCKGDNTLEIFPTSETYSHNTFTKINWQSGKDFPNRKAWIRQGVYYPIRDYYKKFNMFSIEEGGYIERVDSQEIKYPILLTNLLTGDRKKLLITIPFQGRAIKSKITTATVQTDGLHCRSTCSRLRNSTSMGKYCLFQ